MAVLRLLKSIFVEPIVTGVLIYCYLADVVGEMLGVTLDEPMIRGFHYRPFVQDEAGNHPAALRHRGG